MDHSLRRPRPIPGGAQVGIHLNRFAETVPNASGSTGEQILTQVERAIAMGWWRSRVATSASPSALNLFCPARRQCTIDSNSVWTADPLDSNVPPAHECTASISREFSML